MSNAVLDAPAETAFEFLEPDALPMDDLLTQAEDVRFELVDGALLERNMSMESSFIGMKIGRRLDQFIEQSQLGYVFGPDAGYQCFAEDRLRIRKPDVSFISRERMLPEDFLKGFCPIVPDLAVEVVSPNDLADDLSQKVEEYLQAGVKLIWVIHPRTRSASVFRTDGSTALLHVHEAFSGETVIPGFECPLASVFPPTVAPSKTVSE